MQYILFYCFYLKVKVVPQYYIIAQGCALQKSTYPKPPHDEVRYPREDIRSIPPCTILYSHQFHLLKYTQAFCFWIVGLEKINQPIASALNNTCSPKHALCKQCGGNLLNGQNEMVPFNFMIFGDFQGQKIPSIPESLVQVLT